jgi:hypothetical protein
MLTPAEIRAQMRARAAETAAEPPGAVRLFVPSLAADVVIAAGSSATHAAVVALAACEHGEFPRGNGDGLTLAEALLAAAIRSTVRYAGERGAGLRGPHAGRGGGPGRGDPGIARGPCRSRGAREPEPWRRDVRTASVEDARAELAAAVAELRGALINDTRRPEGVGALSRARLVAQRAGVAGMDVDAAWRAALRGDLSDAVAFASLALQAVDAPAGAA